VHLNFGKSIQTCGEGTKTPENTKTTGKNPAGEKRHGEGMERGWGANGPGNWLPIKKLRHTCP